jgi:hypothetical protein
MTRRGNGDRLSEDPVRDADDGFPSCPLGLPQVARACLGFYERGPAWLQLRFGARDNEGLCDVVVEEGRFHVAVRVILCSSNDERLGYRGFAEEREHIGLEHPLGSRTVIDIETGRAVPFYVPTYLDGRMTKAPGYYTDKDEALAASELQPEGAEREVATRGGLRQSRTCGF